MTKTINDWEKVVRSLISFLVKDGFMPYKADNCEDSITSDHKKRLANKVCECDEGNLYVRKGDFTARLYIVLGNNPSELVSDYGYKSEEGLADLEATLDKFSQSWELRGDACPRKLVKN
jgi:hypothetical protein